MADQVIKDDGTKQPFEAEKIRDSIEDAAEAAGLSEPEAKKLSEELGARVVVRTLEKDIVPTSEIRQFILAELDKIRPAAAEAWRQYEKTKKR